MMRRFPIAVGIVAPFGAATVLAIEGEGLLSRTDLLADYPGDRSWFGGLPNAGTVTLGHLLHHSAGLPDHVHLREFQEAWPRIAAGDGVFDPEEDVGIMDDSTDLVEATEAALANLALQAVQ